MTKADKEQIQYLLTQYLERDLAEKENESLFSLLNKEQDNAEWEEILEELIASETEQTVYNRQEWDRTIQSILSSSSRNKTADFKSAIQNESTAKLIKINRYKRVGVWVASIAAIFLITMSIWFVFKQEDKSIIATTYGQLKKFSLKDKTEIILNANSAITYEKQWKNGEPREVWLKGEALFKVTHLNVNGNSIKQEERFIVHTNLVNVEVLGTVFNIRERRGKTEIVLGQGKIKVSFNKSAEPNIIMQPGQIITITAEKKKALVNTIKSEEYTAWTKNKLILTNASFREIVEYMEDNFGKKIILKDQLLANRKVEGTFKIDNLDDALLVLSKALNVDIEEKNDTLIFTSK